MADTCVLNPFTGRFDDIGPSTGTRDGRYIRKVGDTITGDLQFVPVFTGIILKDGVHSWRITVNTNGSLVTTQL